MQGFSIALTILVEFLLDETCVVLPADKYLSYGLWKILARHRLSHPETKPKDLAPG